MGLGSTAKKIQMVSDRAEQMYKQVQELQQRIVSLEEEVDDTHQTVNKIDHQLADQRELLLAIADEHGIDGEQILADAAIDEAEAAGEDDAEVPDDGDSGGEGVDEAEPTADAVNDEATTTETE